MLKKIVIGLLIALAVFAAIGMVLGDHYRVERSITVQADAARVHELCGELENWPQWAPWQESDPTIVTTLGEKTTGVGAYQSWTGDSGSGELTFTRCDPQQGISYQMNFIDGDRKTPAIGMMNYSPAEGGVRVAWVMEGKMDMPVVGGYFALLADPMIGGMFQQGLDKLKKVAESKP